MDQLNKFLTDLYGKPTKVASHQTVEVPDLDVFSKVTLKKVAHDLCRDQDFLEQFEGTPLLPQAVALAEQELATEQRHLAARQARAAQRQNENWEQDSIECDQIRMQKQQLLLELYKMKAMTPPSKPGDAVIGQPEIPNSAATGATAPGADAGGGAPEAQVPKLSGLGRLIELQHKKIAGDLSEEDRHELSKGEFALPGKKKYPIPDEAHARNALARASQFASKGEQSTIRAAVHKKFPGIEETAASKPAAPTVGLHHVPEKKADVTEEGPHYIPELLPFGSTYVGYQRGKQHGRGLEGALHGAAGGTLGGILGSIPGQIAMHAGHPGEGALLASLGGLIGGAHGTNLATRHLVKPKKEQEPEKTSSLDLFPRLRSA